MTPKQAILLAFVALAVAFIIKKFFLSEGDQKK